jgi:hypothetical protein
VKKKLLMLVLLLLLSSGGSFNNSAHGKVSSIDDIQDLRSTHWAYEAVKNLVEKYGIEGYPDQTFQGNTYASRFEMAAALDQVALVIGEQMAKLGMEKADRKDLETVIQLQREFETELAAFKLRAEAIERKNLEQDVVIADHEIRIEKVEKVKNSRDILLLTQADQGGSESNAIGATVRVRNDTEVSYHNDNPESIWGEGKAFIRLTGAVGRQGPLSSTIPTGNVLNLWNDVASDESAFSESVRSMGGFTMTRGNFFVEQALISQDIKGPKGAIFNLQGGLMDITNYFDLNAVANSENTQFNNLALVNNRAFMPIYISPGAVAQWYQPLYKDKLNFTAKAALLSVDIDKLEGAFSAIYEGDLQYFIKNKEGNIRVGGYNGYINSSDRQFVSNRIPDRNGYGMYLSLDQQLYKNMRVFARYGVNDSGPATQVWNNVRQAVSFGAELPIGDFIKSRPNDVFGIAYAYATPILNSDNNPTAINSGSEKVIEAYYKAQINDMLSIGPHFQAIISPGGFDVPAITVIGLRTYLTF